jgi:carbamoyltransferase
MKHILGISAFYHDSAAALLADGAIIAAAQEERFTRVKHDHRFPTNAIQYCLREAGIGARQLDYICFYDKPLLKFERLLETYLGYAPAGIRSFGQAIPLWLKQKLHMPREICKGLEDNSLQSRILFTEHHESHAASAFFPSPYDKAAIITCDGVGEWATTTWGVGEGNRIELQKVINFPHSLGLLYSAFTYFSGFKVNSGEYKLMGLAPYGQPLYADLIRERLIDIKPDGSFRLNMDYFTYSQGLRMTGRRFARLFGGAPRNPKSPITQREMDLAASIQLVTEEIVLAIARHVHRETRMKNLCLAGGVALNCVANGRILREGPFDSLWIQPAAGDAGGALGAALFTWHQLLERPRHGNGSDRQNGSLLGPAYRDNEIREVLDAAGATHEHFEEEAALLDVVSEHLDRGKVIGWFNGRMEFGPRALGCRSIIGDARNPTMQSTMNLKIKFRESFRPFAPCVLQERVHEVFEMRPGEESPYMLLVAPVRRELRHALTPEEERTMKDSDVLKRVNVLRSTLPAITHVDYSARVQTVDEPRHGRFYRLMKRFEQKTGCPVIVNTSFNIRGEPIVNTPQNALNCFLNTHMDTLVLNNLVLRKEAQPARLAKQDSEAYKKEFQLD